MNEFSVHRTPYQDDAGIRRSKLKSFQQAKRIVKGFNLLPAHDNVHWFPCEVVDRIGQRVIFTDHRPGGKITEHETSTLSHKIHLVSDQDASHDSLAPETYG